MFFNVSSSQRSSCFVIWDRTNITVLNTLFTMNSFNLIEIDSSQESRFFNCSFFKNSAPKFFLDVIRSNIVLEKIWFVNNNGTFLTLAENSILDLKFLFFKNLLCNEDLTSVDGSLLTLSDSYFSEIQLKGSLFHIIFSYFVCRNNLERYVSVERRGAFVKAELSNVFVYEIYILEIPGNVFYIEKSSFEADKGYYLFKNTKGTGWRENEGVLQARGSLKISIRGFLFEGNRQKLISNRFLYFVNCQMGVSILESYFRYGVSMKNGGMGWVSESNVSFSRCFFKNNFGGRGGAIFFTTSKGKK